MLDIIGVLFLFFVFWVATIFMRIFAFIGGCILALTLIVWVLEQISNFSS